MRVRRLLQVLFIATLCVVFLGADTDQRYDYLGHRLMCQCGCNQILLECNHVGCTVSERMIGELKAALARGESDQQVLDGFMQKYGAVVLAAPTTTGFNRVAWIVPYATLALGLAVVAVIARTWKRRNRAMTVTAATGDEQLDEFRRRARQETEI